MKKTLLNRFYKSLYKIRRVEEEIARVYPTDKIKSPVHLSIGQEAVSVGVCEALGPRDIVFGTYRGHALYLAKGGNLNKMIAELYGKVTGCAKGKGGSMHLIDTQAGFMGTSAVVGTSIPQAVGYAYALKSQGSRSIVVSFFGDGATDEGVFWESVNFATLKKLPIIFICENNFYAIHTHVKQRQSSTILEKVKSYGIPSEKIENNDIFEIYDRVGSKVQALRQGVVGPFFFECMTYRWKEHVGPNDDFHLGYRGEKEREPWVKNDQVKKIGQLIDTQSRKKLEARIEKEIQDAFAFAEKSPFPRESQLYMDVFKE